MNKIEIVLASNDFGTLIECDTEHTLRSATCDEYERTVASWDAGAFGVIGVYHNGSLRRCYVHRPLTAGELDDARAMVEPVRAKAEWISAYARMRNMVGMGA